MAYPYYPTYQPYGSYLPAGYQPAFQQQIQQPNQTQNSSMSGIIWVSGMQEAQMYPVAPNNAVALWEQSGKTIYLKSADATGKPTMRIYDLIERSETASAAPQTEDGKMVIYATKDDLTAALGVIKGLSVDIEQIKGDLYGLSGKRKAKKAEVEEDDA